MFDALVARVGKDQLKGFGRLIAGQLIPRMQAAEACGIKAPTLILCDHEFAALAYFLATGHGAFTAAITPEGKIEQPTPAKPEAFVQAVIQLGHLNFQGCVVCSEGRAMAVMKEMAEAHAAAATN
jgi:hypothetical protein